MSDLIRKASLLVEDHYHEEARLAILGGDVQKTIKTIPSGAVSLIITSPPYNIGKEYEVSRDLDIYMNEMAPLARELFRVLAPDGSLCWQVGNYVRNGEIVPLDIPFYGLFSSLGFKLRNRVIWHFDHGLHASKRLSGRYETLLWFTKTDHYVFNLDPIRVPSKYPGKTHYKGPKQGEPSGNPLGKNPSDYWRVVEDDWDRLVWEIPNVKCNHPEKTEHPCQFPVELVQRCVLAMTNEDDLVLDPFGGVGTTLVAAAMHGRRALMCEREDRYAQIARERIALWNRGELKVRPLGKPVFQPTGKEKVSQVPVSWQTQINLGE